MKFQLFLWTATLENNPTLAKMALSGLCLLYIYLLHMMDRDSVPNNIDSFPSYNRGVDRPDHVFWPELSSSSRS